MPIAIPQDILDSSKIIKQDTCDFPQGHCFGSDGGSGIPKNLQVFKDRGGTFETWTLDAAKIQVLAKQYFSRCQYCLKYVYAGDVSVVAVINDI